jgi:predicted lipid-binding transport protein (Tim44 family)
MLNGNDFFHPMMGGFGLLGMVLYGIFTIIAIGISVGVTILLVRFLVITTKAAQLYIAKNSPAHSANATPAKPEQPAPATATAPTVATATPAAASVATTTKAAPTKPATKPRTPKTPPVA